MIDQALDDLISKMRTEAAKQLALTQDMRLYCAGRMAAQFRYDSMMRVLAMHEMRLAQQHEVTS